MQYIIDLDRYGITKGSLGKPPYSNVQYEIALGNVTGIQKALNEAAANGYSEVILPKGTYSVCYCNMKTLSRYVAIIPSNITFNMNYSTIDVIFDSDNRSPYDESSEAPYKLAGTIFSFDNCINGGLKNGFLRGDIYNRSFSDRNDANLERTCEGSVGVRVAERSHNIHIENMDICGFMGDCISGQTRPFGGPHIGNTVEMDVSLKGYINDNLTIDRTKAGCYYSPLLKMDRTILESVSKWAKNVVQLQTSGGYTRIPSFGDVKLEAVIIKYDPDKKTSEFSRRIHLLYLDYIVLRPGENRMYIQRFNEPSVADSISTSFAITDVAANQVVIERCTLHDSHRGGISNVPDFTVIRDCQIFNNGMDSGIGVPAFHDSTRYQLNFEDTYSKQIIVENCNIFGGILGILISADNCYIKNCYISDCANYGIVVYNTQQTVVSESRLTNAAICLFENGSKNGVNRYVKFVNNKVVSSSVSTIRSADQGDAPFLIFDGNYFDSAGSLVTSGLRVTFNNNVVILNNKTTSPGIRFDDLIACFNNQIYGTNEGRSYMAARTSGGNYFEKVRFTYNWTVNKKNNEVINLPEGYYKDCTGNFAEINNRTELNSVFNIRNSTVDNCSFVLPSLNINQSSDLFTSDLNVEKSKLIIGDKTPFAVFLNAKSNVLFKDSVIEYVDDTVPYLLKSNRAGEQLFDVEFSNTIVRGVSDIRDYITNRGALPV